MSGRRLEGVHTSSVYVNRAHMSSIQVHRVPQSIARGTERVMRCLVAVSVLFAAITTILTAQERDTAAARTLVEVVTLDSTIRLDVKYATQRQFHGPADVRAGARVSAAACG